MLATQISYWANIETQRHNRAMERLTQSQQQIDVQNAETNRLNALTNQRNAASNRLTAQANLRNAQSNERNSAINSVNALTQIEQLNLARERFKLDTQIQKSNLDIGFGNLALNQLISDRNYELGLASNKVASTQAAASTKQAQASLQQARAATSQANSAAITANANAAYTNAKTEYQQLENDWYTVNNSASLAGKAISSLPVIGDFVSKHLPQSGKKTRGAGRADLPNSKWDELFGKKKRK